MCVHVCECKVHDVCVRTCVSVRCVCTCVRYVIKYVCARYVGCITSCASSLVLLDLLASGSMRSTADVHVSTWGQ